MAADEPAGIGFVASILSLRYANEAIRVAGTNSGHGTPVLPIVLNWHQRRSMNMHLMRLLLLLTLLLPRICWSQRYTPVSIPTRDGKTLAADLYASDTTVKRPAILIQTPYNKNVYRTLADLGLSGGSLPYDSSHYNYVILDWRGFYGSSAAAKSGYDRGLDGYDAVEWIAAQGWCDGKVGTWGGSALGAIQFMTARQHPPHLVCSVPMIKDFKTKYSDNYYGGVFRREHVETVEKLGLTSVAVVLAHPTNDVTWQFVEAGSDDAEDFTVPMLLVSGWFDHYPDDILRAFRDLRERSDPAVREEHRLIMGPWLHSGIDVAKQGELEFPNAVGIANDAALRFFDFWLRGVNNTWRNQPVVTYYQMGENVWKTTNDWSSVATSVDTLYLAADRTMSRTPDGVSRADSFRYDPRDPSPSVGGSRFYFPGSVVPPSQGPMDQRPDVESRSDLLVYSTPVLSEPMAIDGPVKVELQFSSNRYDTDASVRLCDVYPDGRSMLITQAIRRLRFRSGYRPADTLALNPDQVVPVTIELQNTAITILPGHRLRLDVASSCWPHFDLNPNTGGPLYLEGGDTVVAVNHVLTGGASPSRVLIPIGVQSSGATASTAVRQPTIEVLPNPFGKSCTIRIESDRSGLVTLDLTTITGGATGIRIKGGVERGSQSMLLETGGLPPGLYMLHGAVSGRAVSLGVLVGGN